MPRERRASMTRSELVDEDGRRRGRYNFSIAVWKTWLGAIAGLFTIAGIVFGAARLGVRVEVRDTIQTEIAAPLSPLNMHIGAMVDHAMDMRETSEAPMHANQNAEIAALKVGQAERRAQIELMQQNLAEMRLDIKELLKRVR